ncbi:hypothetical protein PybrP1_010961 [[Pythium] brassicae (nom. inval.)]|nr:hypothetical protein PybrP1_010961 [[Pythium] brassicae (nom. inval.)]
MVRLQYEATVRGHLDAVWWLHEQLHQRGQAPARNGGDDLLAIAIRNGHFDTARFIVDNRYQLSRHTSISRCAQYGILEMIKRLHSRQRIQGTGGWIDEAAGAGHLHVLQWLHAHKSGSTCTGYAMSHTAAWSGHLEVIKWLHANRQEGWSIIVMDKVAKHGHLEIVSWLHTNRHEGCTTATMDKAAMGGHLRVVQWLHANRREGCTTRAMDGAGKFGHLAIVQWLHTYRLEGCTTNAMDFTSSLEVMQWLYDHQAEWWTAVAMADASSDGKFEKLFFLRAKDLGFVRQFARDALDYTYRQTHFELSQWLRANYSQQVSNADAQAGARRILLSSSMWSQFFEFEAACKRVIEATKASA